MNAAGGLVEIVGTVVALLATAALVLLVTSRLRIPYAVALVVLGVLLRALAEHGPAILRHAAGHDVTPDVILFVFLPTLIFESAHGLDGRQLRRNLQPILTLAVPGLLLGTAVMGLLLVATTSLALPVALLLGAMLSATDPVAVVALFRQVGAPQRLTVLVEGESLFNDATALVAARILTGVVLAGTFGAGALASGAAQFVVVFVGGVVVGVVLAVLTGLVLGQVDDRPMVEISLTTALAYGSFLIAEEGFHVSGVMATVAAAVTLSTWGRTKITPSVRGQLGHLWEWLAFFANALIFLLVGLRVDLPSLGRALPLVAWAVAAMLVSRGVVVFGLLPMVARLPGGSRVDLRYQAVMFWGGLRGAIAIAIVLSLPAFEGSAELVHVVTGAVLFTLLVQGTSMEWLVRRLGLDVPPLVDRVARLEVDLLAKARALTRIPQLRAGGLFSARIADGLRAEVLGQQQALHADLAGLRSRELDVEAERRLVHLACLATEVATHDELYARGQLSEGATRDLALAAATQADALRHEQRLIEPPTRAAGGGVLRRSALAALGSLGLTRWQEELRRRDVAREYEDAWGRHQACLRVLESLAEQQASGDVREDLVREVQAVYTRRSEETRHRVDEAGSLFPEFVADMQSRLAHCLVVHAEREAVLERLRAGALPQGAAETLLAVLAARLRHLRERPVAQLTVDPAELLRTVPFFRDLARPDFERVAAHLRQRTELAGSIIIRQGERGDSLFLLTRGVVRVCRAEQGAERELATLLPGDVLGEMALLTGEPRSATCRAATPCVLHELRRSEFDEACRACPAIQEALLRLHRERS